MGMYGKIITVPADDCKEQPAVFRKICSGHLTVNIMNKKVVNMKLTFIGATHEVTGSCTMIEINGHIGLVDYGMEQGKDVFQNVPLPVDASELEFILLTHAHIDHSGMIPLLYKQGCRCLVYATGATCSLCEIMLEDCAYIQESEAEYRTRKALRAGREPSEPVYTLEDARKAVSHLRPVHYGQDVEVCDGLTARFSDAGHLMGSASIEIWLTEGEITKKVIFSGDIGNYSQPIIKNPTYFDEADYVITESTYGDRYHEMSAQDNADFLADVIQRTLDRGGTLIIPAFAVGRSQEMLYYIRQIKALGKVRGHDDFRVYLDSPLAQKTTAIFLQCDREYLSRDVLKLIDDGINPLMSEGLILSETQEESVAINSDKMPKVIISASGMCDAGRIRHHLKHNIWQKDNTVLFVGYQAYGTLGRKILDGAEYIKLFGDDIAVKAEIVFMPGKSGHADKRGLLNWIDAFKKDPAMVFINHGDDETVKSYEACLRDKYGFAVSAPYSGAQYDLLEDKYTAFPCARPVQAV